MARKYTTQKNYLGIRGSLTLPQVCIITGEPVQGESVSSTIVQRFFSPLHVILISISTVSFFFTPYALLFYVSLYLFYKLCTRNRRTAVIHYYISQRAIQQSVLWNFVAATSFAMLTAYYQRIFPGILSAWLIHYMFARTEIYIVKRESSYTFIHGISAKARKSILELNIISPKKEPLRISNQASYQSNEHALEMNHHPLKSLDSLPAKSRQSKKCINISGKNLKEIPAEMWSDFVAKDVEEIKISNNPLGKIPAQIFACENIRALEMNNTRIASIIELEKLPLLEKVYVTSNRLREIPPEIRKLSSLTILDVSSNRLKNIPPEISFTALVELKLHNNFIHTVPEELVHLRSLTILDLSHNKISEIPENIGQLKQLQKLYVQNNNLASLPPSLSNLHDLEELNISHNQFTEVPAQIQHLPKLRHLDISHNHIGNMENNSLDTLRTLNLSHNHLVDFSVRFSQLQSLDISHNKLQNIAIDTMYSVKIRQLQLSNNELSQLPPDIFNLPLLEQIYLNNNRLQNIPSPENAHQLKKIELRHNNLREFPSSFSHLNHKVHIDVSQNPHLDIPLHNQHKIEYDWSKLHAFDNKQPVNPFIVKNKTHVIELITKESMPYPGIEKYQQQAYIWHHSHLQPLAEIGKEIPYNTTVVSNNKLHFVREKRRFAIKETFAHYALLLPCPSNDDTSKVFIAYDNCNFCRIEIFEAALSFHKDFITCLQQEIKKHRSLKNSEIYALGQHEQQIYVVTRFSKGIPLQHYVQNTRVTLGENIYWMVQTLCLMKNAAIDSNYITLHNISAYRYTLNFVGLETQKAKESLHKNIQHQGEVKDNKYHFCSPQVLMDKSSPNIKLNLIYSQGIIFFFLLTQKLPFHHSQLLQLILLIIDKPPADMTILNNSLLEQPICDIVYKMIAKKPQNRYQNEQEIIDDIQKHYPKLFIRNFCIYQGSHSGKYYKTYTGFDIKTAQVSSIVTFHDIVKLLPIHKKCTRAYPQIQFFSDDNKNCIAFPHCTFTPLQEKQQPLTVIYFALEIIDRLQELSAYDLFPILNEKIVGTDDKQNLSLNIPEIIQQLAVKDEDTKQLISLEHACNLNTPQEINYRLPDEILTPQYNTATQIYSLGITMYNMLSGSYPYTKKELLPMDSSFYHRRILLHNNDIPQPLRNIINNIISYLDPTYTKWQQLRKDLHQCYRELKTKLLNSA